MYNIVFHTSTTKADHESCFVLLRIGAVIYLLPDLNFLVFDGRVCSVQYRQCLPIFALKCSMRHGQCALQSKVLCFSWDRSLSSGRTTSPSANLHTMFVGGSRTPLIHVSPLPSRCENMNSPDPLARLYRSPVNQLRAIRHKRRQATHLSAQSPRVRRCCAFHLIEVQIRPIFRLSMIVFGKVVRHDHPCRSGIRINSDCEDCEPIVSCY